MDINDNIVVQIIDIGINGEGIAKENGAVIFVPFTNIGDNVNVKIVAKNKSYFIGDVVEKLVCQMAENKAKCPHFGVCGGCSLQNMDYDTQLKFKTKKVADAILKIANIDANVCFCVPSEKEFNYRNKIELIFGKNGLGFYNWHNTEVSAIKKCFLCDFEIEKLINIFNDFVKESGLAVYDKTTNSGYFKALVIRKLNNTFCFTIVKNGTLEIDYKSLIKNLQDLGISFSLLSAINNIKNSTNLTEDLKCIYGEREHIFDVCGIVQKISANSFLQINLNIQNKIYEKIASFITKDDCVIDAYSGAGLLSSIVAKRAEEVYGIEIIKNATKNACELAMLNDINNLHNINGPCSKILPPLIAKLKKQKNNLILILDPPRKGCEKEAIDAILKTLPKTIIYLSCNPASLARDLNLLKFHYKIKEIQPYDMFPQTAHVETLLKLEKI